MRRRPKNPDATRDRLLSTAFDHFQRAGYNASALRDIAQQANATSGALFHHFENKEALGIAVLEGPVASIIEEWWIKPLEDYPSVAAATRATLSRLGASMMEGERRLGCPLGNAANELSNQHPAFASAIGQIYERWHHALATHLSIDRDKGLILPEVDADQAATFIIVGIEGAIALTKALQSPEPIRQFARQLELYFSAIAKAP